MRTRAALFSSCLLTVLAGVGCGDDSDPKETAPPAAATASDAGAGRPDSATVADAHVGSGNTDAAAHVTGNDSAVGASDASKPAVEDDDLDEPAQAPGNNLYTEGPACQMPGLGRVGGSVEGTAVTFDLSSIGSSNTSMIERDGSDVDQRFKVRWKPAAVPGQLSDVTDGFLVLPTSYALGGYCLTEGKVLRDPTITDDDIGDRYFIHITKVQKRQDDGTCSGSDLAADLKICEHG